MSSSAVLPSEAATAPFDGQIKTIAEYRKDEAGRTIKITRKIRMRLVKSAVKPEVAERKLWRKYGDAANDPPGPNTSTTVVGEAVYLKLSRRDVVEVEKPKVEAKAITCQYCQGPHWTARCPHKDKFVDAASAAGKSVEDVGGKGDKPAKYIPPALRAKLAAEAAGGAGPSSTAPRDDTHTIRLSNLQDITTESDIRLLCQPFGHISRVYLSKDQYTGRCKGSAFVGFMSSDAAAKAITRLNGYPYGNIIIKAEMAKLQS